MSRRRWLTSLRARLLLAFILLCVVTAAGVAGATYVRARDVILQKAQDSAVISLTDKVKTLYPVGGLPPSQAVLEEIAGKLSGRDDNAVVVYEGRKSRGSIDLAEFSPALRQAVADGDVAWQRIVRGSTPGLVIGTQMVFTQPDGTPKAALEIYSVRSLLPEQQSIDDLASSAALVGGAALAFAVLLALLATRSVLRPVRELGRAAHQLGEGDLTTRLTVRGADELAGVARTFNNTAEALENQVGELQRMEADARRFVADVSHELRTPLAAMTVVTDVLDEEAPGLSGDVGRAARLVSQETHNLTRLVNDLIEVTRFDSGAAATALDEVDVAAAVNATLRARGWTDQVETELTPDVRARLDPRRLDIILANLVGNALRHGAPPVSVRLFAEPDWITFEVGDRGPGLDPRVLPHVFDRFYKADTARTRSEGSGLGLAIAWENARLHRDGERQGSLVAGNRPDGGAVFVLRLPRYATNAADLGGPQ
ncbi:HAMP domain-containing sensor histidine kinase [Amycolatopsis sp.]|uniref:HAMP domain-containing sensor histidine kinase n=1 Tax=Amycolatopsis sp. TaxID=37632 RepID=UPI002DFEBF24|nr:HAMP domain-containing sensor histidine kinase [Amycolatopsis sp.]